MNLKNPVQLVTARDVTGKVYDALESLFSVDGISNDCYKRYYPIDGDKDKLKVRRLFNEWLINEGYYIDDKNDYFYILVRFDW